MNDISVLNSRLGLAEYVVSALNNHIAALYGEEAVSEYGFGYSDNEPEKLLYLDGEDIDEAVFTMEETYDLIKTQPITDELIEYLISYKK